MARYNRRKVNYIENITFDDVITIISKVRAGTDDYGNPTHAISSKEVLCNITGVYRDEYYSAGSVGLKPSYTVTMHEFEYNGEQKIVYEGKEYDVLRTYVDEGLLELTVGEKIGD